MKLDTSIGAVRWASLIATTFLASACAEDDPGMTNAAATTPSGQTPGVGAPAGTVGQTPGTPAQPAATTPGQPAATTPAQPAATTPAQPAPTMPAAETPTPAAAPIDLSAVEAIPPTTGTAPGSYLTCSVCHGQGGEGVAGLGPEIRHVPDGYFQYVARNGRDANPDVALPMAGIPESSVSDSGLTEINAWLNSQTKPTTGQGLFADYCANCHGVDGAGVAGKDVKMLVANIPTIVRAGANPGLYENAAEYMPSWTAEELTDAEVQLIVDYITALAAAP